jgi:hypothetical protein
MLGEYARHVCHNFSSLFHIFYTVDDFAKGLIEQKACDSANAESAASKTPLIHFHF